MMNEMEQNRFDAELSQLNANTAKIQMETMKIQAEAVKLQTEDRWYPLSSAAIGAIVAAIVMAMSKLF